MGGGGLSKKEPLNNDQAYFLDKNQNLYRGDVYDKGSKFNKSVDYVDFNGNEKNKGYFFFSDDKDIAKSYSLSTDRLNIKLPKDVKISPNVTTVNYDNLRLLNMAGNGELKQTLLQDTYSFLSKVKGKDLNYDEVASLYGFETKESILKQGFNEKMWEITKGEQDVLLNKMKGITKNESITWNHQLLSNFENGVNFKSFLKKYGYDGYRFIDGGGVGGIDYAIFNDVDILKITKEFLE